MSKEFIKIGGAREHNLKNLTLEIPRDKLVVITRLERFGEIKISVNIDLEKGELAMKAVHEAFLR